MSTETRSISGPFEQRSFMDGHVVIIYGRVEPGSVELEPLCTVGADIDENDAAANLCKADFILRACNSFDDLLSALKGILDVVNVRIDDPRCAAFDAARAAIQKAEGK